MSSWLRLNAKLSIKTSYSIRIAAVSGAFFLGQMAGATTIVAKPVNAPSAAPAQPSAISTSPMLAHFTSDITPLDKPSVLFVYDHNTTPNGNAKSTHSVFKDKSTQQELVVENSNFQDGHLVSYEQVQKQIGAEGKIEVSNGEVHFTYSKNGKTKTNTEKLTDNFVVSSSLVDYIAKNWDSLKKGDEVSIRFGVVDRLETVGFKLFKVDSDDPKKILIKMKPSSFVIAAIVNPLIFTFSSEKPILLQLKGRTPLKVKSGDSWKDFDGVSTYHYEGL